MQAAIRTLRRIIPAAQTVMVVVFLALFLVMAAPGALFPSLPLAAWGQIAKKIIWEVWFPATLFSVIVFGRLWCGLLCPMGALAEIMGRYGPRLPLPGWLRSPALPVAAFVAITILGQVMGVRDDPRATVKLLGGVMLLALLTGLLYGRGRNRPWCRHACPIGLLLGLYGRLGAIDFRPRRQSAKPVATDEAYAERGVCPTMIELEGKKSARHCIECLRCVEGGRAACEIAWRLPGAEIEDIGNRGTDAWEVAGLFLGAGVALGGFLWLVLPHYVVLRDRLLMSLPPPEQWPLWILRSHTLFPWLMRHPPYYAMSGVAIVLFMGGCMMFVATVLAGLSVLAAALTPRAAGRPLRQIAAMLGYAIAPMALVSLLIGLGGGLFGAGTPALRLGLLAAAAAWSLALGWRILANLKVPLLRRVGAMLPGLAAVLFLTILWSPALGISGPPIQKLIQFGMPGPDEAPVPLKPAGY
jgi:hypothetical protein